MPCDQRSRWDVLWRISVSAWWPFDGGWRVEMRFHRMKKEVRCFQSPAGSSSNDCEISRSPPIVNDLSRYNSRDQWLRLIHLSEFWSTCVDWDRMDLVSIASTCDIHRDLHPTFCITPRVLQSRKQREYSPTWRKRRRAVGYIRWADYMS